MRKHLIAEFWFDIWQWFMFVSAILIVLWGIEEHHRATSMKHFNGGSAWNAPDAFTPSNRSMAEITFDAFAGGALTDLMNNLERLSR
jgi:hypothetical protein